MCNLNQIKYHYPIAKLCLLFMCISLCSCLKEDDAILLESPKTGAQLATVNIGADYNREIYFDLDTKDTLGSDAMGWDLAFECNNAGNHIWINGGNGIKAAKTSFYQLNDVHDTLGCNWKFDSPSWDTDSTAFGQWSSAVGNNVYVIEKSLVSPATPQDRFWKIIVQQSNSTAYTITYARLTDTISKTLTVPKNPNQNYTHFSFNNNGTIVNIEPDKQKWDIVFTRYRFIYYDFSPPLPYYVNGVLLNSHLTFAAVDSVTPYDSIQYAQAVNYTLKSKRDAIGFEWKLFNFTTQKYDVKPYYVFIIKDQHGYYYKLHFLNFYDSMGNKGYPTFEYHRL